MPLMGEIPDLADDCLQWMAQRSTKLFKDDIKAKVGTHFYSKLVSSVAMFLLDGSAFFTIVMITSLLCFSCRATASFPRTWIRIWSDKSAGHSDRTSRGRPLRVWESCRSPSSRTSTSTSTSPTSTPTEETTNNVDPTYKIKIAFFLPSNVLDVVPDYFQFGTLFFCTLFILLIIFLTYTVIIFIFITLFHFALHPSCSLSKSET